MADAIVSVVLQQLLSILSQQVEQEVRLVVGVEEEIQKLTRNFKNIQDVLEDAEKRQVKEANVKTWLEELKDVSYDIDDVLDEWNTALLRSKVESEEKKVENGYILKVCSCFPTSCFCFKKPILRRDIAKKIKELNERLDAIASERTKYAFQSGRGISADLERRITSSFMDEFLVSGREENKKVVIRMLLEESSQEFPLQTISIVGMGGLGKTTLAQLAFNDRDVKEHFDESIWVCVSDPFDEIRVAKAILESIAGESPNLVELENLLQKIQQSVENKKFLLVMDDVWNEDSSKWASLEHSLKRGLPGSKILVTTRKESVASIMGTRNTHMYFLKKLSEEECWSVFSNIAFFGRTDEECKHLEEIGMKIASKSNGLPLAAKFLGGLLRFRKTREQWESVLDSQTWELEEAEQELFPHLLLSYYDLPSEVRQCFLYRAIFPKDYKIEKEKLIRLWMAQGYLKRDMEIVGQVYFDNLAMRSFFQDFEYDDFDRKIKSSCKMHDIVHDFAQFLTKNECLLIEESGIEMDKLKSSTRHSMIVGRWSSFPDSVYGLKKLRSLLLEFPLFPSTNEGSMNEGHLLDLFCRLTCLRSLSLDLRIHHDPVNSIKKFPKEVGQLIHLRLLDLSRNEHLIEIPESLCNLYNLQTLNIRYCGNLRKLPHGMGKLINLRHLVNQGTFSLRFMPKGLGKSSQLRTLEHLFVGIHSNDGDTITLGDLQQLNNLGGVLEITGLGYLKDAQEATNAQLVNKKHLGGLGLQFDGERADSEGTDHVLLEALQPHLNLEILSIYEYEGPNIRPSWLLQLERLRELSLEYFKNIEELPRLGILPALRSLYIRHMPRVKKVGLEFLGMDTTLGFSSSSAPPAFPQLQKLSFVGMENWEEWVYEIKAETVHHANSSSTSTSTFMVMPRLSFLSIMGCPKLKDQSKIREDLIKS